MMVIIEIGIKKYKRESSVLNYLYETVALDYVYCFLSILHQDFLHTARTTVVTYVITNTLILLRFSTYSLREAFIFVLLRKMSF